MKMMALALGGIGGFLLNEIVVKGIGTEWDAGSLICGLVLGWIGGIDWAAAEAKAQAKP